MNKGIVTLLLVLTVVACEHSQKSTPVKEDSSSNLREGITIIDGVERSELALTMRNMYDQMKLVRDSLEAGKDIKTNYLNRYKSIHTDVATEPEKIDEVYQGMAANFIRSYSDFESSETDKVKTFNNMLDACLACHQQKCPGPIKAINKLKINEG